MNDYKIVVLTSGFLNSRRLCRLLSFSNYDFNIITISYKRRSLNKGFLKNFVIFLHDTLAGFNLLRTIKQINLPSFSKKPIYGGRCNSIKLIRTLNRLKPDYIFMMGGGIINSEVIKTARIGVLNAHPGLLPELRGRDVIKHAILNNKPICVTTHYINEGIDTGNIICKYLVPIEKNFKLHDIELQADHLCCAALIKIFYEIISGNIVDSQMQQNKYEIYNTITNENSNDIVKQLIEDGVVYNNYLKHANDCEIPVDGSKVLEDYFNLWGKNKIF